MHEILDDYYIREALTSFIFIAVVVLTRFLLIRVTTRGAEVLTKDQRRWIVRIKNTAIVIGILGIIMIWAPQLHTLALSLTAIAVAVVVALKEVILCITAAFVRVTTTPFRVGDWIVLEDQGGEVIDIDAFTLRIQEVDVKGGSYEYTGRIITIPNSKIFTANVVNLNFTRRGHMYRDVNVNVAYQDVDPAKLVEDFRQIVKDAYTDHREKASDTIRRAVKKSGVGLSSPDPDVGLRTTDLGHYVLSTRLFVPVEKGSDIAAQIVQRTVAAAYAQRTAKTNSGKEEE